LRKGFGKKRFGRHVAPGQRVVVDGVLARSINAACVIGLALSAVAPVVAGARPALP
jgi:hypothetical protein